MTANIVKISDDDLQAHLEVILENPATLKAYDAFTQGVHNQSPDLGTLKNDLIDALKAPGIMPARIAEALPDVIEQKIKDNGLAAPRYVKTNQPQTPSSRNP